MRLPAIMPGCWAAGQRGRGARQPAKTGRRIAPRRRGACRVPGVASSTPRAAFSFLLELAQKHLKKVRGAKPGLARVLDAALQDIQGPLTGFPPTLDLEAFFHVLLLMFDHDRSAARGEMAARRLVVFRHRSTLGEAPAHRPRCGVAQPEAGADRQGGRGGIPRPPLRSAEALSWTALRARLLDLIDPKTNGLRFYLLGSSARHKVEHVGSRPPRGGMAHRRGKPARRSPQRPLPACRRHSGPVGGRCRFVPADAGGMLDVACGARPLHRAPACNMGRGGASAAGKG
ncbi:CRISPR-associated protein (Cas_Csd1) [Azospirillum oryzae]|uniref:CRISPR-associated protein (Cas_Csd1) n=2 Tax=Azospirillum oryzae TaxID=286727 RepID=A0A1X7HLW3_9PROT|nr:CRISPR-associated protein (Cas_Csd1) [Azospirillum oryzae]